MKNRSGMVTHDLHTVLQHMNEFRTEIDIVVTHKGPGIRTEKKILLKIIKH